MSMSSTIPTWQPRFLAYLAKTGNVLIAAHRAHITRQNAYLARSTKNRKGEARLQALAFAQCWQMALQESFLPIQEALYDRAMHGVERQKPIYYKGKQVGLQKWTVYNDSLLIHLHKSIEAEISKADALLGDYDLTSLSPADFAEREAIENLTDELWCQVLDILEPAPPKTKPSEAGVPKPEPTIKTFISPISVSSLGIEGTNNVTPCIIQPALAGFVPLARGLTPGRSLPADLPASIPIPEIFSQSTVSSLPIFQEPSPTPPFPSSTPPPPQPNVGAHTCPEVQRRGHAAPQTAPANSLVSSYIPEIFPALALSSLPIPLEPGLPVYASRPTAHPSRLLPSTLPSPLPPLTSLPPPLRYNFGVSSLTQTIKSEFEI